MRARKSQQINCFGRSKIIHEILINRRFNFNGISFVTSNDLPFDGSAACLQGEFPARLGRRISDGVDFHGSKNHRKFC
ncbi:MAG: hypothetical protein EBT92_16565 [Planctomycetes bacterium]|nr:hypothetical protein [Planctomycetota bacterium]NBY01973.1 hypothetical protein [Planctomycetota bacterium]